MHKPVQSVAEFKNLDEAEVLIGYLDAVQDACAGPRGASRAYAHGWHNGLIDLGLAEPDSADHHLDAAFQALEQPTLH